MVAWGARSSLPADYLITGVTVNNEDPFVSVDLSRFFDAQTGATGLASLIGPFTAESNGFVPSEQDIPYTVRFQNPESANSVTSEVRVSLRLEANADPRTFRVGQIQLGSLPAIDVPVNQPSFSGEYDFVASRGFILRVSGGIDLPSATASWVLQAIDPATGEVIRDPARGLLPANNASGDGSGFVKFTVRASEDIQTRDVLEMKARVALNNAPPEDTPTIRVRFDADRPQSQTTVDPSGLTYSIAWSASDVEGGSGLKSTTLYVSEDNGPFRIWKKDLTESSGTEIYLGEAGRQYRFLSLATDKSGNREQTSVGSFVADSDPQVTASESINPLPVNLGAPKPPSPAPSTNPLFVAAERGVLASPPPLGQRSDFASVLQPLVGRAFATGFVAGEAGIGPLAIVEDPDGSILVSGGPSRNQLFRYGREGGDTSTPLATLNDPIFSLAFDRTGQLWATTGGRALLRLNPTTGEIVERFGDGITMSLAVHPTRNEIYVTSQRGIEIFTPSTGEFRLYNRDRDLRFGNIAFDNAGNLWGTLWPQRNAVVQFNSRARAETRFEFDTPIDSIAFGKTGSDLDGLLFVTANAGVNGRGGDLTMIDLVTRRRVAIARDGSRGDTVAIANDGRIFISQSDQVDVLNAQLDPVVVGTNPPLGANVALPFSLITVTFDQDMLSGDPQAIGSVVNAANYTLRDEKGGQPRILRVSYDPSTFTVLLTVASLSPHNYELIVSKNVRTRLGVAMRADYSTPFTTLDSVAALVDLRFLNSRLERATDTISYDVTITNRSDRPLILPLFFALDPTNGYTGIPVDGTGAAGQRWLISLAGNVPGGVRLDPNASTTGRTISILSPDGQRVNFNNSVSASVGNNASPVFTSTPNLQASANAPYTYNAAAIDPDTSAPIFVLVESPAGMTVDPATGVVRWLPQSTHSVSTEVALRAYDPQGAWSEQFFTITLVGGNHRPVFAPMSRSFERYPGSPIVIPVAASDQDNDELRLWATNVPPGAVFDLKTRALYWTPTSQDVRTYSNIRFFASDSKSLSSTTIDITILPKDLPPTLQDPGGRILREGDTLRIQLIALDPDDDAINYSATGLPRGVILHPVTGLLSWTPEYNQAGVYNVTLTASANGLSHSVIAVLAVLKANAIPEFDAIERWRAFEDQTIEFRVFARDPDNPEFAPPIRKEDGTLLYSSNSRPTVTYRPTKLLPDGASFDAETGIFRWRPGFNQSGTYEVTFSATDDGDGVAASGTATLTVPIEVIHQNQAPVIPLIQPVRVPRGELNEFIVTVTDPDGDPLTLTAASELSNRPLPSFISFTDLGGGRGRFKIQPQAGDRGSHPITLTAIDTTAGGERWGRLTTKLAFVVNVDSPNDPPVLAYVGDRVAIVGQPFEIELRSSDLDQEPLSYSLAGLTGAQIVPGTTYGQSFLRWTPTAANAGNSFVTVTVSDSGNGIPAQQASDSESFVIAVRSTNTAPSSTIASRVFADERQPYTLLIPATDPNGDKLRYASVGDLPAGALLDSQTGRLTWVPFTAGDFPVEVSISDGNLSATASFTIVVRDVNQAPVLQPLAPQYGREGAVFRVLLGATDPDIDPVTLTIDTLPRGAKLDPTTNVLTWIPDVDQAGDYRWTVTARDPRGGVDSMPISVRIDDVNRAPTMVARDYAGVVGRKLEFQLSAVDDDRDVLSYSALRLPDGATVNASTGMFSWTPRPGQAGEYLVTFFASDGKRQAQQTMSLVVTNDIVVPFVQMELVPSFPATPNENVQVRVTASSRVGIQSVKLFADGVEVPLNPQGFATLRSTAPGQVVLEAIAEDRQGVVGRTTKQLKVRDVTDTSPPIALLDASLATRVISQRSVINGRVSDSNLDVWRLEMAPWGTNEFVELNRSIRTVDGRLTEIDPASLANGVYRLRLSATDISGRSSAVESKLEINSSNKSAVYRWAESEVALEKAFGTIRLTRVYDSSLNLPGTSFGEGWRWAELDYLVQSDTPRTGREVLGVYEPMRDGTRVYVSLPNGNRVGFTFAPEATSIGALTFYKPRWQADPGAGAELRSVEAMLTRAEGKYYELGSGLPYHPSNNLFDGANYRIKLAGGEEYFLDAVGRTTEIVFGPGCSVLVSDNGIAPDGIAQISIVRDAAGRVTRVSNGPTGYLEYRYDVSGRLTAVTDDVGTIHAAYRYDEQSRLAIAHSTTSDRSVSYAAVALADPIDKYLGGIKEFTGKPIEAQRTTAEQRFSLHIAASDLASTPRGEVMLRIVTKGIGNSAPPIVVLDHATPVSRVIQGNQVTSLFVVTAPGMDLIRVTGPAGNYSLDIRVAGDIDANTLVDGNDANAFADGESKLADGQTLDPAADHNGDGKLDFADRLVLLYNYGFTTSVSAFAVATGNYPLSLERGSDDSDPRDDNTTSLGSVTIAGLGTPFQNVSLAGNAGTAQVLLNGMFAFFHVPLLVGPNPLTLQSSALLSATSIGGVTVTRIGSETTAPTLTIGLAKDTGSNNRDRITSVATLSGTATDVSGIRTLQLSRANGPWIDVTTQLSNGSYEITGAELATILNEPVTDGRYDLRIQAIDALANESTILNFSFVLDTLGPDVPTQFDLSASSDSGLDDSDSITNRREIILTAFANPGDRIEAILNGQVIGSQLSTGPVSIPVTLSGPGSHSITLVARDEAGNPSGTSSPLVISVDEMAPVSLTTGLSTDTDSGVSGDNRTDRETIALVGQTDPGSSVAVYRGSDFLNPIARVTASANGQYRIDGIALSSGANALVVSAEDTAGNARKVNLSLETTASDASAPSVASRLRRDTGRDSADRITNDSTVLATVDDPSGVTALTVSVNGGPVRDAIGWLTGSLLSLSPSRLSSLLGSEVVDGSYTLTVNATDVGGRVSTPSNFSFTLDTTRPTPPTSLDLAAADDTGISSTDNITRLNSFSLSTNSESSSIVRFYRDGQLVEQSTNGAPRSFAVSNLADGTFVFIVSSEDIAGNVSSFSLPTTILIDRTPPIAPAFTLAAEFRDTTNTNTTPFDTVRLTGQTDPETMIKIEGSETTVQSNVRGEFSFSDVRLVPGANVITMTAQDKAGNIGSFTSTITLQDRTGPHVQVQLRNDTGASNTDQLTKDAALSGLVRDASGVAQFDIRLDGGAWKNLLPLVHKGFFELGVAEYAQLFGSVLNVGSHQLEFRSADRLGNSTLNSVAFTFDNQPPGIMAPNLLPNNDTGLSSHDHVINSSSATLVLMVPTNQKLTWFNLGSAIDRGYVDKDGHYVLKGLPEGHNVITVQAEDLAGNVSAVSMTLEIIVDTSVPTISLQIAPSDDTGVLGDRRTDRRSIQIEGVTEPDAVVLLSNVNSFTVADGSGKFAFQHVWLEPGENVFDYEVSDVAGNRWQSSVRFYFTGDPTDTSLVRQGTIGTLRDLPQSSLSKATIYFPKVIDESYNVSEDEVLTVTSGGLLTNDHSTHPNLTALSVVEIADASGINPHLVIAPNGNFVFDTRGSFNQLGQGETALYELFYRVTDGLASSTGRAMITIAGKNDAPTVHDDVGFVTRVDRKLSIPSLAGVLRNDFDPDENDRLMVTAQSGLSHKGARVTINADGSFVYDPTTTQALIAEATPNPGIDDWFTYTVSDRFGETTSATVRLTVIAGNPPVSSSRVPRIPGSESEGSSPSLPPFEYQVVVPAGTYSSIGDGISLNNNGWAAFTAQSGGYSNVYGVNTFQVGAAPKELMHPIINHPVPGANPLDLNNSPSMRFGDYVQINDNQQVLAQRVLYAKSVLGDILFIGQEGLSNVIPLTFLETWDATRPRSGKTTKLVAMGDTGLYGAGLRLESIGVLIDPFGGGLIRVSPLGSALLLGALLPGPFGVIAMAEALATLARPPVIVYNPVWAGYYPSKFDTKSPFSIVYPNTAASLNNNSQPQYVFNTRTSIQHGNADYVTTAFNAGTPYLGAGPNSGQLPTRIADNGVLVAVGNGAVQTYTAGWNSVGRISNGFTRIGNNASIADDGSAVAFAGVHSTLGTGIFIARPDGSLLEKIAGTSRDGRLDPGEQWDDVNNNNRFDTNGQEDVGGLTLIDLDAQVNVSHADTDLNVIGVGSIPRYYVQFAGKTVASGTPGPVYGLQAAQVLLNPPSVQGGSSKFTTDQISTIAYVGQIVPGIGAISELSTHDGLHSKGDVLFVAKRGNSKAILLAHVPAIRAFVDSNNDTELDLSILGKDYPIRNIPGQPGKVIDSGLGDADDDGTPDWLDGYDNSSVNNSDEISSHKFAQLVVEIPENIEISSSTVVAFRYKGSSPAEVRGNFLTGYSPAEGRIRIWKKDGNVVRNSQTDYLESYAANNRVYSASALGLSNGNRSITLFVEGVPISEADQSNPNFDPTTQIDVLLGKGSGTSASFDGVDSVRVTVTTPILQIDADNNNGYDLPDRTDAERAEKNPSKDESGAYKKPGKVIVTSRGDSDGDGIPDYADGLRTYSGDNPSISSSEETKFVPVLIELPRLQNPQQAKLQFTYDAADPERVQENGDGTFKSPWSYAPGSTGKFRLWLKDGNQLRSTQDYINPQNTYTYSQLNFRLMNGKQTAVLYLEALVASQSLAEERIIVAIDPDGSGPVGFAFTDTTRVTAIDLTVAFDDRSASRINHRFKDLTSKDHPQSFWINNDTDRGDDFNASDDAGFFDSTPDGIGTEINSDRDLEDLIAFQVTASLLDKLGSEYSVKLEFPGLNYTVHVFRDRTGQLGTQYLYGDQGPQTRSNAEFKSLGFRNQITLESSEFRDSDVLQFLLEGYRAGSGAIKVSLVKSTGTFSSDAVMGGDRSFIAIDDVDALYNHFTAGNALYVEPTQTATELHQSQISGRLAPKGVVTSGSIPADDYGAGVASNAQPDKDYTLFVHGWRMQPAERESFAETALKRLFWQGYTGSFGFFSWPTDWTDTSYLPLNPFNSIAFDQGNYDRSEMIAWKSSDALLSTLQTLRSQRSNDDLNVFAHSMGNIVVGEALRKAAESGRSNLVDTYVATQAATPANAYDSSVPIHTLDYGASWNTPEIMSNYLDSGRSYFQSLSAGAKFNYYNPVDPALTKWVLNQYFKPDNRKQRTPSDPENYDWTYKGNTYSESANINLSCWFDSSRPAGWYRIPFGLLEFGCGQMIGGIGNQLNSTGNINDRYEIFAFAHEYKTLPLGRTTVSGFTNRLFSFGDDDNYSHSAQFLGTNMQRASYWNQMVQDFRASTVANPQSESGGQPSAPVSASNLRLGVTQLRDAVSALVVPGLSMENYYTAVIDTGFSQSIHDFSSSVKNGPDFGDGDSNPTDLIGHGTSVGALIVDNRFSNGPSSRIVVLKTSHDPTGDSDTSDIEAALRWVLENHRTYNIVSINLSLGFGSSAKLEPYAQLEPLFRTLNQAGVFIAVAAGNGYGPSSVEGLNTLAASKYVTAVGAVWTQDVGAFRSSSGAIDFGTGLDRVAAFSQRDSGLDILAPGGHIQTLGLDGQPTYVHGTSFATPFVSNAAAVLRNLADQAGLSITPNEIRDLLRSTGKMIFDGDDEDDNVPNSYRYYPRLDLAAAVAEMQRRITAVKLSNSDGNPRIGNTAGPDPVGPVFEVTPNNNAGSQDPILVQSNPGLGEPTNTWAFRGNGQLDGSDILLSEHQLLVSNATRTYALNPSKNSFKFEIRDLLLRDNGTEQPPDAFEVALTTQASGGNKSFFSRISSLSKTDGLLNIQRDGTYYAGSGITVAGTVLTNGKLDLAKPILVTVDISALPQGTNGTLSFDLIGFGVPSSSARIIIPEGENTQNAIAGFVYVDSNNNGTFDLGEQPINGATVTLSGSASRTVNTGANGAYRFDNLLDGTYTVTETQPVGFNDGRDTQGSPVSGTVENDRFLNIVLADNIALTGYNFGEQAIIVAPTNSISGFVYVDANDNGIFDSGELPISGAAVTITGPVNLSMNTRTDGSYSFASLPNGVYTLTQNQVAGYSDGRDTQGTPVLGTLENDRFVGLNLTGNIAAIHYNFGEREIVVPQTNSISGFVYVDANDNGLLDLGEQPIRGAVIELTGTSNQTFVTGNDGAYRFTTLGNGTYTISQQQPAGFDDGRDTRGTPALGLLENDRFVGLNLAGNVVASNYNFGERLVVAANSSLSGSVYIDMNRNGIRDGSEPGLKQVEIRLSGSVVRSVFTNDAGRYFFGNLPAGTYNVFEVQPTPYDDGDETLGNRGGTVVADGFNSIVLDGTVVGTGYDFGEHLRPKPSLNSIGGIVYLDVNNNGRRDLQELVVPNVQVTLSGTASSTTFTGVDGTYVFVNLPDGVYTITESHPADFLDGIDTLGTPPSGILNNDQFEQVALANNTVAINYNFGERGLRFPSKIHLLASTPPAEQIILERMTGASLRWKPSTGADSLGFNPHYSMDTDNDGTISPLDVLVVINAINLGGSQVGFTRTIAGYTVDEGLYLDVDGDRYLSPLDVLTIVNYLNARSSSGAGEGESDYDVVHDAIHTSSSSIAVLLDLDLRRTKDDWDKDDWDKVHSSTVLDLVKDAAMSQWIAPRGSDEENNQLGLAISVVATYRSDYEQLDSGHELDMLLDELARKHV